MGLAALVWIEVAVVVAIYKTIFKGGAVNQAVSRAPADMPPWGVRLLATEAKFWLKAWDVVKQWFGKQ